MLKILKHIVQLVKGARDIDQALHIMVHGVKEALETQACSIYLCDDERQEFILAATEGLCAEAVGKARLPYGEGLLALVADREEPINLAKASENAAFFMLPELKEECYNAFLAVPIVYHRQLLGVIVVQQTEARRFDDSDEAMLLTLTAQLARFIFYAKTGGELKSLFGAQAITKDTLLTGIPVVRGVAIGTGVVIYPLANFDAVPGMEADNIEEEIILLETALQAVRDDMVLLNKRLAPNLPEKERELFNAYLQMLDPESLGDEVIQEIRAGQWAQGALKKVVKRFISQFEAMDNEYMRERADDILDIGQRVLSYLQQEDRKEMKYPAKTILVGEQISAANLAEVPEGRLAGIISTAGSKSSHVAIFAKAMNVPTVMGIGQLSPADLDEEELIVDGYYGQVYLSPSDTLKKEYQRLADEEIELDKELENLISLPAETKDGHRVKLFVNTGLAHDVGLSLSVGAEGVGLYRSEVPFLTRDRFPSGEEQRIIYRQLLGAFAPRPVVMRTLDIGGDKALPYFPVEEENPFLGWRGMRILLDHPEIFLLQVRSMLRASDGLNNLKIMFPMVTDLSEIDEGLRLVERAYQDVLAEGKQIKKPKCGVMIEVPSAVYLAKQIAQRVDFLSIGSNDLTQYILAVDRNNPRVSNLYNYLHPSVLGALKYVATCAQQTSTDVSLCGEMASDPIGVVLLMAMGYDTLSMHSHSLPRMKWVVRQCTMRRAKKLMQEVMAMRNVADIRKHMEIALEGMGLGGLIRAGR